MAPNDFFTVLSEQTMFETACLIFPVGQLLDNLVFKEALYIRCR